MKSLSIRTKLLGTIVALVVVNGVFAASFFPAQQRRLQVESLVRRSTPWRNRGAGHLHRHGDRGPVGRTEVDGVRACELRRPLRLPRERRREARLVSAGSRAGRRASRHGYPGRSGRRRRVGGADGEGLCRRVDGAHGRQPAQEPAGGGWRGVEPGGTRRRCRALAGGSDRATHPEGREADPRARGRAARGAARNGSAGRGGTDVPRAESHDRGDPRSPGGRSGQLGRDP